jgi:hypothetical protein
VPFAGAGVRAASARPGGIHSNFFRLNFLSLPLTCACAAPRIELKLDRIWIMVARRQSDVNVQWGASLDRLMNTGLPRENILLRNVLDYGASFSAGRLDSKALW